MYCYHCGKKINELKIEKAKSSFDVENADLINDETTIEYVCPRCGHLIHENMTYEDGKSLSRATHAQLQRGANDFARGMSFNLIGIIALAIGLLFFVLAMKPAQGFKLQTHCAEFIVFIALTASAVILLGMGIFFTVRGISTKRRYGELLRDLNNNTFVQ